MLTCVVAGRLFHGFCSRRSGWIQPTSHWNRNNRIDGHTIEQSGALLAQADRGSTGCQGDV